MLARHALHLNKPVSSFPWKKLYKEILRAAYKVDNCQLSKSLLIGDLPMFDHRGGKWVDPTPRSNVSQQISEISKGHLFTPVDNIQVVEFVKAKRRKLAAQGEAFSVQTAFECLKYMNAITGIHGEVSDPTLENVENLLKPYFESAPSTPSPDGAESSVKRLAPLIATVKTGQEAADSIGVGKILLPHPTLCGAPFGQSLVLITHHERGEEDIHDGAVHYHGDFGHTRGIILNSIPNRRVSLQEIFRSDGKHFGNMQLQYGGPVMEHHGDLSLVHNCELIHKLTNSHRVGNGWFVAPVDQKLVKAWVKNAEQTANATCHMYIGGAGWAPGQLEGELQQNSWALIEPAATSWTPGTGNANVPGDLLGEMFKLWAHVEMSAQAPPTGWSGQRATWSAIHLALGNGWEDFARIKLLEGNQLPQLMM
eukprot:TRINITY_DN68027_c11_g8_i1.p1 TRINITY_DN68027_c11_g8~~TRINITY_DN68027_c11_g8_i1.p1  ORF type:complete len:423 (-),score=50.22 TRINITY_DN68027_c11_g8_i1:824-2092(-)